MSYLKDKGYNPVVILLDLGGRAFTFLKKTPQKIINFFIWVLIGAGFLHLIGII